MQRRESPPHLFLSPAPRESASRSIRTGSGAHLCGWFACIARARMYVRARACGLSPRGLGMKGARRSERGDRPPGSLARCKKGRGNDGKDPEEDGFPH